MWQRQRDEEEAPDTGFVDEDGTLWELDPNDPRHPDYDLSEAAGYGAWEPAEQPNPWLRRMLVLLAVLAILGMTLPLLIRLLFY
ncbi:MAG: hypothetical protein ACUVV3_06140 [Dehalococcoidia bacterium]